MKFDKQFRQMKNMFRPHVAAAEDDFLRQGIASGNEGLLSFIHTQSINPDALLKDGETVVTLALKTGQATLQQRVIDYDRFDKNTGGIQEVVRSIEARKAQVGKNMEIACVHFSDGAFLKKLGIPKHLWPDPILSREFFQQASVAIAALRENEHSAAAILHTSECIVALNHKSEKNAEGEDPVALNAVYNDTMESFKNGLQKQTHDFMTTAYAYDATLNQKVTAKEFLNWRADEKIQAQFPWLDSFKPDETTFLNLFDPGWPEQAERIRRMHELQKPKKPADSEEDNDDGGSALVMEPGHSTGTAKTEENENRQRRKKEQRDREEYQQQQQDYAQQLYLRQIGFYAWQRDLENAELQRVFAFQDMVKQREKELSPREKFMINLDLAKQQNTYQNDRHQRGPRMSR